MSLYLLSGSILIALWWLSYAWNIDISCILVELPFIDWLFCIESNLRNAVWIYIFGFMLILPDCWVTILCLLGIWVIEQSLSKLYKVSSIGSMCVSVFEAPSEVELSDEEAPSEALVVWLILSQSLNLWWLLDI